ncbi:MAG: VIT domain-containing protein [Thermodesulfobacteriota bacterium]
MTAPSNSPEQAPALPSRSEPGWSLLVLGVIYPAAVLVIELSTRMCADTFFDPMPTLGHALFVAFVPTANLLVWLRCRHHIRTGLPLLQVLNGAAIGIAAYFSLLFLPIMPLAAIAIIWAGMGLLPMAPFGSLIAAILFRRHLRNHAKHEGAPTRYRLAWGFAVCAAALLIVEIAVVVTHMGMDMAASNSPTTVERGVRLLRLFGKEGLMLRACYTSTRRSSDFVGAMLGIKDPVRPEQARDIYYRVTGRPFTAEPMPSIRGGSSVFGPRVRWDRDVGGEQVAGKVDRLALDGSRIDGSVDCDAALGYLEWTMVFTNGSPGRQEARALVGLPPGGVVSRATLWVNGREQEAAFAERARVRQAYQKVVLTRRDPLLITTAGPDAVLVQCFPVPPNGGSMKIRVGITVPLVLLNQGTAALRLPHFKERNFASHKTHAVWIESKGDLAAHDGSGLKTEQTSAGIRALRGEISESRLLSPTHVLTVKRSAGVRFAWTRDKVGKPEAIIIQRVREQQTVPSAKAVLVIDGSESMRKHAAAIAKAVDSIPPTVDLGVIHASDKVEELRQIGSGSSPADVANRISRAGFAGGCDNVPALRLAVDRTADLDAVPVVWIHGPQPARIGSPELLVQYRERRPVASRILSVEVEPGRNRLLEDHQLTGMCEAVPRLGSLQADLERLFEGLFKERRELSVVRERMEPDRAPDLSQGKETSSHLARLWADSRVRTLLHSGAPSDRELAVKIASDYALVTPVSGAVCLETKDQFRAEGLTPVPETPVPTVPTIPEPETWALIIVCVLILLAMARRRLTWQSS